MRLAIAMGLHRKLSPERERAIGFYAAEMRKRCFWSAYIVSSEDQAGVVPKLIGFNAGRSYGTGDSSLYKRLLLNNRTPGRNDSWEALWNQ